MKTLKLILIVTVITLAIGGIYLYVVFKHRQDPGVVRKTDPSETLSKDDLAVVRTFFPAHFEDTQRLEGTSVWMKNGYTIPYFPYSGRRHRTRQPSGVRRLRAAGRKGPVCHSNRLHGRRSGSVLHRSAFLL